MRNKQNLLYLFGLSAVAGMLVAMVGAGESFAQQTEIKVGYVSEPTSVRNPITSQWALERAVDILNAPESGTSEDYRVTLVPVNIPYVYGPDDALQVVGALQQSYMSGVKYYVGATSSATAALSQTFVNQTPDTIMITHAVGVPFVPLSPTNIVNLGAPNDGFFRLVASDRVHAAEMINLVESEGRDNVVILIRDEWVGIVDFLIPSEFRPKIAAVYPLPIGPFTSDAEAISQSTGVVAQADAKLGELIEEHGSDSVSVVLIANPSDFANQAKTIMANPDLQNVRDVKWYTSSTITGESATFADDSVGMFAIDVDLTGTRYVVEPNDVNRELCAHLNERGATCDEFVTLPYGAYDAVHLLVDSVIVAIEAGDESQARNLILDVAAGHAEHAHEDQHEDSRVFGDGALGEYTLDAAGDLQDPATYTILEASVSSVGGVEWTQTSIEKPPMPKHCR